MMMSETLPEFLQRTITGSGNGVASSDSVQRRIAIALERIADALDLLVGKSEPSAPEPEKEPEPAGMNPGDWFRKDIGERREGAWHVAYTIHDAISGRIWACGCGTQARRQRQREHRPIQTSQTRPESGRICYWVRTHIE
jgi:hypothetical protein